MYSIMIRVEDRTLTYRKGLPLQIVTWIEICLVGTHTTFCYIYYSYCL